MPSSSERQRSGRGGKRSDVENTGGKEKEMREEKGSRRLSQDQSFHTHTHMYTHTHAHTLTHNTVSSVRRHTAEPGRVHFHVLVVERPHRLESYLRCRGIAAEVIRARSEDDVTSPRRSARTVCIHDVSLHALAGFEDGSLQTFMGTVQELVSVRTARGVTGNLASPANFARFLIPHLFASQHAVLYLDVDTVVQGDVTALWADLYSVQENTEQQFAVTHNGPGERGARHGATAPRNRAPVLAAVPRVQPTYGDFFSSKAVRSLFAQRRQQQDGVRDHLDESAQTFNAGVLVLFPQRWLSQGIDKELVWWMQQHYHHMQQGAGSEAGLWDFGTQPLLLLCAYKRWAALDARWNVNGLGYRSDLGADVLNQAFLLHWNGRQKPWLEHVGLHRDLWLPYFRNACSHHGTCDLSAAAADSMQAPCTCQPGWSGSLCQASVKS